MASESQKTHFRKTSLRKELLQLVTLVMIFPLFIYILVSSFKTYNYETNKIQEVVKTVTRGASLATQEALWN